MEHGIIRENKSSYYNKSKKKNITSVSKYVNLGVSSIFNKDDEVVVFGANEHKQIIVDKTRELEHEVITLTDSNKKLSNTIDDLEQQIRELTNKNDNLMAINKELSGKVSASEHESTILKREIHNKNNELSKYNDIDIDKLQYSNKALTSEVTELNKELAKYTVHDIDKLLSKSDELDNYKNVSLQLEEEIKEYKDIISYYKDYIHQLENRGLLQRIRNTDVSSNEDVQVLP